MFLVKRRCGTFQALVNVLVLVCSDIFAALNQTLQTRMSLGQVRPKGFGWCSLLLLVLLWLLLMLSKWHCTCGVPWHKCMMHVHEGSDIGLSGKRTTRGKRSLREVVDLRGVDRPLPKVRRTKSVHEAFAGAALAFRPIGLRPGSKLAARFPHLVQGSG